MPTEEGANVRRYETLIVTLVGVSALFVSAYTAYVQRQQVRAAVWPILEYRTSNDPKIRFTLDNKGVGPAIIRHVVVRVDGEPVRDWNAALQKLLGPGEYKFTQSTISGHVMAAGESMDVMVPHDFDGGPLTSDKSGALWAGLDKERGRVAIEICYSSTLGDCWILRRDAHSRSTTSETRSCPDNSAASFQQ
ncbi:MAG: hypothetical protein QOH88_1004 [Verrucomicrobiota bacterium]